MAISKYNKKPKALVVPAFPPDQPLALAQVIDQALLLLAERSPNPQPLAFGQIAPLPSLLDRCEALLERRSETVAPLRVLHSFGSTAGDVWSALLSCAPNVREWTDTTARSPDAVDRAVQVQAKRAEVLALQDGYAARGLDFIIRVNHLADDAGSDLLSGDFAETLGRPIRACVLAEHPLLSYLKAVRRGQLSRHSAGLEAYAERYLKFLDRYADLALLSADTIEQNAVLVLGKLARALHLSVPNSVLDDLRTYPSEFLGTSGNADELHLRYADDSPATEEALDGPAYVRLCNRLGVAPDALPAVIRPPSAGPLPTPLKRPLPPRPQGRKPSRIADFVSLIARITDAPDAPAGMPDASSFVGMIEDCLGHPDGFYEALEAHLAHLAERDAAVLLMGCAAHFCAVNEPMQAFGLLAEAEDYIDPDNRALCLLLAELFLRLRKPEMALAALTRDAMDGRYRSEPAQQKALKAAIDKFFPPANVDHGHSLLIDWLEARPEVAIGQSRVMIEIGKTRERVAGQGSTEKLALLCNRLGIDFITVDMDPRNSAVARRMFRKRGLPFRAVTAKGEDFLASWTGTIDYCFLDAYDFDHGKHGEVRQSRYETFLGSRIADEQCHQMHLDCAVSLVAKLSRDGVICLDDTWTDENGAWTAKGTTAMPYLLENDFKVILARNRAALLVRV